MSTTVINETPKHKATRILDTIFARMELEPVDGERQYRIISGESWELVSDELYSNGFDIRDFDYSKGANITDELTYAVENLDDDATPDQIRDCMEDVDIEPDIYTHDLTGWLHSNVEHVYYLTEALETWEPKDGFALLTIAQGIKIRELQCGIIAGIMKNLTKKED
jgi:hypothetical protein